MMAISGDEEAWVVRTGRSQNLVMCLGVLYITAPQEHRTLIKSTLKGTLL